MIKSGAVLRGGLNIGLTVMLLVCVVVILVTALARWVAALKAPELAVEAGV